MKTLKRILSSLVSLIEKPFQSRKAKQIGKQSISLLELINSDKNKILFI